MCAPMRVAGATPSELVGAKRQSHQHQFVQPGLGEIIHVAKRAHIERSKEDDDKE